MNIKIVSFGSISRDIYIEGDFNEIDWQKTVTNKAVILPLGEKIKINNVYFTIGGNALNAAVTFKKMGFNSICVGKIGQDVFGIEIIKILKKIGVTTEFIKKDKNLATGCSFLILKNGERTILTYPSANQVLTLKDLNLNLLKADYWYVSLSGDSYLIFEKLVNFAKKNNIFFAFNPTGYHLKKDRKNILKFLKDIDFLVLNEAEASYLTKISFKKEKAVFKKLDFLMPKILAVTYGNKGSLVSDNYYIYRAKVFKNKKVLDRTGAGDAFGAGFLAGLAKRKVKKNSPIKKEDILFALKLATANATKVVEKIGATENILTFNEFLKSSRFKNLEIEIKKINF